MWDLPLIFCMPCISLETKKLLLLWNTGNAALIPEIVILSAFINYHPIIQHPLDLCNFINFILVEALWVINPMPVMGCKFESAWDVCAQFESMRKDRNSLLHWKLMKAAQSALSKENRRWGNYIYIIIQRIYGETSLRGEEAVRGYASLSNCAIWLSEASWLLKTMYNSASPSIRCCTRWAP